MCWLALCLLVLAFWLPWFKAHDWAFALLVAVMRVGALWMNWGQFSGDWHQPEAQPLLALKAGVLMLALSEREPPVQVGLSQVAQVSLVAVPARVPSARWRIRVNLASGEVVEQVINANGVLPTQVGRTWIVPQLQALLGHERVQVRCVVAKPAQGLKDAANRSHTVRDAFGGSGGGGGVDLFALGTFLGERA